jgi:hypothetical protein
MSIGDDDINQTPSTEERKSNSCLVIGLIIGGLTGVTLLCGGCCIGSFYFRANSVADDIASDLQNNPVMAEHIGDVESLDADLSSLVSTDEQYVFHVTGTLNSGTITADCVQDGDGLFHVMWGELELDNGEVYELFPDGRDDLEVATTGEHNQFWSDTYRQDVIDRLVKEDIADQEVLREHIGAIQRLASDEELSLREPGDVWVFDISGEQGAGMLRANCVLVSDNDIDVDSAVLMLDSGENVQLFPEKPMDPLPDQTETTPESEPVSP